MKKDLNNQIIELMFSVSRLMKEEMKFSSESSHLSLLQIQALLFIEQQGEVQMKDLAEHFTITLPTATTLSDNLLKTGLIKRLRGTADRRVVTLKLSSRGSLILEKIVDERNKKITKMLSYLSHDEKEALLSVFISLKASLEKSYEK